LLNDGDAFLLDAGYKIYTWFGSAVSAFERNKSASMAHNIQQNRNRHCELILDVDDDNEEFWALLGGKSEIKPANIVEEEPTIEASNMMYEVSDEDGKATVRSVEVSKEVRLGTEQMYDQ
jgi:hypothetical protein